MKFRLIPFIIIILLTCRIAVAQDEYPINCGIDVTHYTFRVYLEDSTDMIRMSSEITFSSDGRSGEMGLDLRSRGENGKGMEISVLNLDDKKIKFEHKENRITVFLPVRTEPWTGTLYVGYSGVPTDGMIISKNKHGERTFFADNWPDRARNWLACVDHPSDKATVDFIVTAPAHYQVVGVGYLSAVYPVEKPGSQYRYKVTKWSESVGIPTKVMVIGAADFAWCTAGFSYGIPVQTWVYSKDREVGFIDYEPAVDILTFYQNLIGPYAYEKLANVQSKTIFGGMENSSCIFYYENSVKGNNGVKSLLAHEIAHQWFGDAVTEKDWHHIWLSEGFATYLEVVYADSMLPNRSLEKSMLQMRQAVITANQKNPKPVIDNSVTDMRKLLNTNSYQKGAWVLHMLRNELGDELFWKGIRQFYQEYKNKNALTEDFCKIMEEISGRDLAYFFDQWLRQPDQLNLEYSWKYDDRTAAVDIKLIQTNKGLVFRFPLTLSFIDSKGKSVKEVTVLVNSADSGLSVPLTFNPASVELDPHVNLLFTSTLVSSSN